MTGRLELDRLVAAAPDRVWDAWTTERGLAGWWWRHWPDTTYEVDLRIGGAYRIAAADHGIAVHGAYETIDPPRTLAFSWVWAEDGVDGPMERVEVTFAAEGDGTRVSVLHTGPWTTRDEAESYRQGWEFVLDALAGG
jgi:uncharacterized protein YndB with AHSA1/START domain